MKTLFTVIVIVVLMAGAACAEEKNFAPKDRFCVVDKTPIATEPIGAVVETTGVFVGKIVSAAEIAFTGERKLTVENETGETRVFPFSATTKIADGSFHAATFDQLKKDRKVAVEYAEEGGVEKAEKVVLDGQGRDDRKQASDPK